MTHRGPGGRALTEEEKAIYYPPKPVVTTTTAPGGHDHKQSPKVILQSFTSLYISVVDFLSLSSL